MYHNPISMQPALSQPTLLFENEEILAFDKPPGWLTRKASPDSPSKAPVLMDWILKDHPDTRLLHRLDIETSGCVIFAKGYEFQKKWMNAFSSREIKKEYLLIANGSPSLPVFKINSPIEGKPAITQVEVKTRGKDAFIAIARIVTGRRHQVRIHLASLGFSLFGDKKYGGPTQYQDTQLTRVALHAHRITLPNGIRVEAPIPQDFQKWQNLIQK